MVGGDMMWYFDVVGGWVGGCSDSIAIGRPHMDERPRWMGCCCSSSSGNMCETCMPRGVWDIC
jgi:hypothetical protein